MLGFEFVWLSSVSNIIWIRVRFHVIKCDVCGRIRLLINVQCDVSMLWLGPATQRWTGVCHDIVTCNVGIRLLQISWVALGLVPDYYLKQNFMQIKNVWSTICLQHLLARQALAPQEEWNLFSAVCWRAFSRSRSFSHCLLRTCDVSIVVIYPKIHLPQFIQKKNIRPSEEHKTFREVQALA